MMQNRRVIQMIVFAVAFSILLSSFDTCVAQDSETQSKLLVSADWLADAIESKSNIRIIDLPMRKTNYETGHIPGAVYLDWRSDIIDSENNDLYRLPKKAEMEKVLSKIGVTNDTTVVLTDNMGNRSSVRMYYTLKYFGHKDVRVLNGGTSIWQASGRDLTIALPSVEPADYNIKETHEEFVVKLDVVKEAIDGDFQLIDGRPREQFTGETAGKAFHTNKKHARKGHVPSARNIPWKANLNADGSFKSLKELKQLYESNGIDTESGVVTYCNEGLHAAMPWFVLRELFGNQKVKVYDDSMVEWANRDDTPLEKND